MDKNQVVWQDELLKYSITRGENLSFKSGIYNREVHLKSLIYWIFHPG